MMNHTGYIMIIMEMILLKWQERGVIGATQDICVEEPANFARPNPKPMTILQIAYQKVVVFIV